MTAFDLEVEQQDFTVCSDWEKAKTICYQGIEISQEIEPFLSFSSEGLSH